MIATSRGPREHRVIKAVRRRSGEAGSSGEHVGAHVTDQVGVDPALAESPDAFVIGELVAVPPRDDRPERASVDLL